LRGVTWRRIQVEIAPDEAGASSEEDVLTAPNLAAVGLPNPDQLVGIAARWQVAQKLHACTDPHNPPESVNDRVRDVVDLVLLKGLLEAEETVTLVDLKGACVALFAARAREAETLGRTPRTWPCRCVDPYGGRRCGDAAAGPRLP
jgi:hypothetical protein